MRPYIALAAALSLANATLAADSTQSETRIRQLQEGLVPPVLVRGDTPAMPTLAARMAELNVPGVSIAVIHDGRIEWARGFGATSKAGPPVTPDTLFQAASISKPVFSLGVLHLVDAGKLKLDTNVSKYLRSWKLPENEFTANASVTLRRLLSHSAGTTVHGFPGYASSAPVPTLTQVLDGIAPANTAAIRVDIAPGSRHRYSGGGYEVAQQAVMDVTNMPLPRAHAGNGSRPVGHEPKHVRATIAARAPLAGRSATSARWPARGRRPAYISRNGGGWAMDHTNRSRALCVAACRQRWPENRRSSRRARRAKCSRPSSRIEG